MEFQNLDFDNRLITFPKSKTRPRIVVMTERAYLALARWGRKRGTGPGSLWRVDDPYILIERVVRKYSQGKIGAHTIKRAFAVHYIAIGGSESALMRTCGWSGSEMVRLYTKAHADVLAHNEFRKLMC